MIACDCDKAREYAEAHGLSWGVVDDDRPKALLLSGRMCRDGETLDELVDKAHKIIKASKKNDIDSGTGQPDSEAIKPRKRKRKLKEHHVSR